jgi:hypothetical protein
MSAEDIVRLSAMAAARYAARVMFGGIVAGVNGFVWNGCANIATVPLPAVRPAKFALNGTATMRDATRKRKMTLALLTNRRPAEMPDIRVKICGLRR